MAYEPYIFTLSPIMQTFFYLIMELIHQKYGKSKFDRELFTCADGGTMGISWYVDKEGVGRPSKDLTRSKNKPVLLLYPGLGGGVNNLYTHTLAKAATKEGYKCGVVLFRCAEDIPITSFRVTCSTSENDASEVIDYVYQNYILD